MLYTFSDISRKYGVTYQGNDANKIGPVSGIKMSI